MNLLYTLALTSVYIYNSLGQYLSVGNDGKPVLSKKPVAMEVTPANETPSKDANRWNFGGKDIKWILKSSADGTYTLGYQDSDAYSTAFVYTQNGTLATSYEEPAATFKSAQWKYSTEAPKNQAVTLDEAQNYAPPYIHWILCRRHFKAPTLHKRMEHSLSAFLFVGCTDC